MEKHEFVGEGYICEGCGLPLDAEFNGRPDPIHVPAQPEQRQEICACGAAIVYDEGSNVSVCGHAARNVIGTITSVSDIVILTHKPGSHRAPALGFVSS